MCPLQDQRDEREDASFAAVVGTHDEHEILDAHDGDQRPEDQRENSVDVRLVSLESVLWLEALAYCVQRTGADVAVDDAQGGKSEFCETAAGRTSFDVGTDLRDLKKLFHAYRSSGGLSLGISASDPAFARSVPMTVKLWRQRAYRLR